MLPLIVVVRYNVALSTMKLRNVVPGLSTPICIACFGFAVAGQLVASDINGLSTLCFGQLSRRHAYVVR